MEKFNYFKKKFRIIQVVKEHNIIEYYPQVRKFLVWRYLWLNRRYNRICEHNKKVGDYTHHESLDIIRQYIDENQPKPKVLERNILYTDIRQYDN